MQTQSGMFCVNTNADSTTLSFGEDGPPNHFYHDECLTDLTVLIEHGCRRLRFDLQTVDHIASGMIGIFTWLANRGVSVELQNSSIQIRQAISTLKLDHLIELID